MYLLGQDAAGNFIFFTISHYNGKINYTVYHPVNMNEFDWDEYTRTSLENADEVMLYELCCQYDCRPSELADYYVDTLQDLDKIGCIWVEDIDRSGPWRFEEISWSNYDNYCELITTWYDTRMNDEQFMTQVVTNKNYAILDAPQETDEACLKWMKEHLPNE